MTKRDNPCWFPLRKVVGVDSTGHDILECGHRLSGASDIYGPRYPDKRRCHYCWRLLTEEQREEKRKPKLYKNCITEVGHRDRLHT